MKTWVRDFDLCHYSMKSPRNHGKYDFGLGRPYFGSLGRESISADLAAMGSVGVRCWGALHMNKPPGAPGLYGKAGLPCFASKSNVLASRVSV